MRVPDGEDPWINRALELTPAFFAYALQRFWRDMESIGPFAPEVELALEYRTDVRAFRAVVASIGYSSVVRPELFAPSDGPLTNFLNRTAGMSVLFNWLCQQPEQRRRFLEQAALIGDGAPSSPPPLAWCADLPGSVVRAQLRRELACGVELR